MKTLEQIQEENREAIIMTNLEELSEETQRVINKLLVK